MKRSLLVIALFAILMVVSDAQPAQAYLDPGTGSYSAQVLFAGLLVVVYSLRTFFRQIFQRITQVVKPR